MATVKALASHRSAKQVMNCQHSVLTVRGVQCERRLPPAVSTYCLAVQLEGPPSNSCSGRRARGNWPLLPAVGCMELPGSCPKLP